MSVKYMNCGASPVIVPTSRGGMKTFNPGDFSNDPWFSRFAGKRGLKEVPSDFKFNIRDKIASELKPRSLDARIADTVCGSCETSCQIACESTTQAAVDLGFGKQIGPIYHCNFCMFRCTKIDILERHVRSYHPDEIRKFDAAKKAVETPVVEPVESVKEVTLVTSDETVEKAGQEDSVTTKEESSFVCDVCGVAYNTSRGLSRHKNSAHPEPEKTE